MFNTIKTPLFNRFQANVGEELFTTGVPKGSLFQAYLALLPEEERQAHNCNCCRSFLNQFGDIVWIIDNEVRSLWEFEAEGIFKDVPKRMHELVTSRAIEDIFLSKESDLGTDYNFDKKGTKWTHFHVHLPAAKRFKGTSIGKEQGIAKAQVQVFGRGLDELTPQALNTVLGLIESNQLYRGQDQKAALVNFIKLQAQYAAAEDKQAFVWSNRKKTGAQIRNTAIGTLLIDLSEGKPEEQAVKAYERMVAPTNYRRPTATVSTNMLKNAEETLTHLGMLESLKRRHATKDSIPIAECLHVFRAVDGGTLFEQLADDLPVDMKKMGKVQDISLSDFKALLPEATKVEALFESRLVPNLVNLTDAADPESPNLFQWNSQVAWSYKGGAADSIKERVKEAGGKVDGDVRVSLSWFNTDDLDVSVLEPNANIIYYGKKYSSNTHGELDVDMNAGIAESESPVENITYPDRKRMLQGRYMVRVHNFNKRSSANVGFVVEIEIDGKVVTLDHPAALPGKSIVDVAVVEKMQDGSLVIHPLLPTSTTATAQGMEVWGIKTNRFHPVSMVVPSPNLWGGEQRGNPHTFFIIDDVKANVDVRGFFNEYLKNELSEHRKVFELLGNKVMVPPAPQQLAGLGFSHTMRNDLIVKVASGGKSRLYKIVF
jgi:hypothetical protein